MKPFNLEEAKQGKPVVTRDGRPARILAFDRKGEHRIIGLVTYMDTEISYYWFLDGRTSADFDSKYDLVMKAEKKEGWINLYRDNRGLVHTGVVCATEADSKSKIAPNGDYITTIKVEWEE